MELEVINKNLTPELVKHNHVTELMKLNLSLDAFREMERELVYNEDNLPAITDLQVKLEKAVKVIKSEKEKAKRPIIDAGNIIEAGAKLISVPIETILNNLKNNKQAICDGIERRRKAAEEEKQKRDEQKRLVDNTILNFSERIGNATEIDQLLGVERLLNLELTNLGKFGEFGEEFKTRCNGIRKLIVDRKEGIRKLSELNQKEQDATETGQDEQLEDILTQKQEIENNLSDNSIRIQETASQQAQTSNHKVEQQYQTVKPKRTTKEWEVVDLQLLFKKRPDLIDLVPNKEKIDELLKWDVEHGVFGKDADYITFGIRFFEKKTYA